MRGIEPRAFHMQSERATTALHPLLILNLKILDNIYVSKYLHWEKGEKEAV